MKKMSKKCLYCYEPIDKADTGDFHEPCSLKFFGSRTPPLFNYSLNQMTELAKNVVERSVAVPGYSLNYHLLFYRKP